MTFPVRGASTEARPPTTSRGSEHQDERPFDGYWVGFTDGSFVYTVDLHGPPGSVTEEQALKIAQRVLRTGQRQLALTDKRRVQRASLPNAARTAFPSETSADSEAAAASVIGNGIGALGEQERDLGRREPAREELEERLRASRAAARARARERSSREACRRRAAAASLPRRPTRSPRRNTTDGAVKRTRPVSGRRLVLGMRGRARSRARLGELALVLGDDLVVVEHRGDAVGVDVRHGAKRLADALGVVEVDRAREVRDLERAEHRSTRFRARADRPRRPRGILDPFRSGAPSARSRTAFRSAPRRRASARARVAGSYVRTAASLASSRSPIITSRQESWSRKRHSSTRSAGFAEYAHGQPASV